MKRVFNIGIIGVMLIMGLAFIGCPNDSTDNGGGGGGSLTVSGIASFTGKEAGATGYRQSQQIMSIDPTTYGDTAINGDSVVLSMYDMTGHTNQQQMPPAYTGSDTFTITITIYNDNGSPNAEKNFTDVKFTNGKASVNWADGQDQ